MEQDPGRRVNVGIWVLRLYQRLAFSNNHGARLAFVITYFAVLLENLRGYF